MALHHMLRAAAGNAGPSDPYFEYNTLLLTGAGTNGAQNNTFLDSSTNNFTITRNGNTTQGTFSPYGSLWSNYFDGTGDYLTVPSNSAFNMGTGDWTVEAWVYPNQLVASGIFQIGTGYLNSLEGGIAVGMSGNTGNPLRVYLVSSGTDTTAYLNASQWNHIAFVRNGTAVTLYLNGASVYSTTTSSDFSSYTYLTVGGWYSSSFLWQGYISNLRIVKGTAVYTAAFTPPTTPLTAVSGTSLLTCQSNRFIDNSSNNFTLTVNGNTSVQRFSPFNPTAPYSASTIGGSGYFDGSGDYLTVADNSALELGSSQFCIESFYLPTSVAGNRVLIGKRPNPSTDYGFLIYLSGSSVQVYISSGNSSYDISNGVNIGTLVVGQWHHIAIYRIANAWYASFNGSITTLNASNSSSVWNNTAAWGIGGESNGTSVVQGYIGSTRFVIGSSVYTSISAPVPTSPLTPITNTSLLCNFTNAGIPDAAMMNDLETVGNAQVSTSVKKYGTGSLAFDGTGDYLYSVATPNTTLSGDFTIECWAYLSSTYSAYPTLLTLGDAGSSGTGIEIQIWNSGATVYVNGIIAGSSTGMTNATNTWIHWAVVRSGNSIKIYKNGTSFGATGTNSTAFTGALRVGVEYYNSGLGNYWYGYIDDLRITKGLARYTANFTPPTAALPTY